MNKASLLMMTVALAGFVLSGCSGGVSDSDKAAADSKFKKMDKNDVNHDATP